MNKNKYKTIKQTVNIFQKDKRIRHKLNNLDNLLPLHIFQNTQLNIIIFNYTNL